MRDGVTWRDHFEAIRRKGKKVSVLKIETFDEYTEKLWGIYREIGTGRTSGGMSANPITWSDIESWLKLTRMRLSPAEVRLVRELDTIWMEEIHMTDEEVRQSFREISGERDPDAGSTKAERLARQKNPPKKSKRRTMPDGE